MVVFPTGVFEKFYKTKETWVKGINCYTGWEIDL
jgi:hypothetical protein